jgi:hypothetical protein
VKIVCGTPGAPWVPGAQFIREPELEGLLRFVEALPVSCAADLAMLIDEEALAVARAALAGRLINGLDGAIRILDDMEDGPPAPILVDEPCGGMADYAAVPCEDPAHRGPDGRHR